MAEEDTAQARVTAAILIKEGHILIAKRRQGKHLAGKWEFPGGKIEPGETPEECLAREMKEELGIVVKVEDFMAKSIYEYDRGVVELLAYRVNWVSGELQLLDHDETKWIGTTELSSIDFAPADIPLVKEIFGGQNDI